MLNKTVELEFVEHTNSLLRILRLGAEPNHHAHHLLIDVLAFVFFLHALLINLPAALKLLCFCVAID